MVTSAMSATSRYPEPNNERLLADFLTLVQIDSPSYSEAKVIEWAAEVLASAGCDIRIDDTTELTGSNSGNLIATLSATPGQPGRVFFSAHTDTASPGIGVEPVISADGIITSVGETVLGGDDKVGVAAILETVRTIVESGQAHPEIVILLSVAEEVGLKGAKAIDGEAMAFAGEPCFVLDSDGKPGGVIIGAPFHINYTARFIGKAAHAGVSPESGISAIAMAAKAIAGLPLGRLDAVTTANVGTIEGGSADNVVPESAVITGEMRSLDQVRIDQVKEQTKAVMEAVALEAGGLFEIEFDQSYPGFRLDEDDELVQLVLDTATKLGLPPVSRYTGGGSDANIFAGKGLSPLVLATGMTAVHSKDESLAIVDMQDVTRLLVAVTLSYQP